jgi:folate-binding protein YgfZ
MKDLEHLRILTISGEDAGELLQGQMTQDVRKLEDEKIHITSFCNVQGRVIASSFIQERNDQYDLILSSEIIDDLENHLQRYILRSKVLIEQSDEKTFGAYKSDINEDSKECRSLKNDPKRVLTLSSQVPESIDNFITSEEWIRCDIENSIAIINKESTEKFIPQMLNLDILDAVSFSKGCYTGQEVVARVQHRGKIKQRMFKFKTENEDLISHGSEIHHESKKVGTVVISKLIDNYTIGLAVINSADNESQLNIGDINIKLL